MACEWIADLLHHCRTNVPRYQGIGAEIHEFPIIDKVSMLEAPEAFISDQIGAEKKELVSFMKDPNRIRRGAVRWSSGIIVDETSGTSGIPLNFPKTVQERAMASIAIWKARRSFDVDVTSKNFYAFSHAPIDSNHRFDPFDITSSNITLLYDFLERSGVRWIHSYPALFKTHTQAVPDHGCARHSIRFIEVSGAFLSEHLETSLASAMNVTVVNQYGCREVWAIGYGLGSGPLSLVADNILVEIVDADGCEVKAPGREGKVVVTSRYQRLFPFVRYNTGDTASWVPGEVGRKMLLQNFDRGAVCVLPNRKVGGNSYFRTMVAKTLLKTGFVDLKYLQVRQEGQCSFTVVTNGADRADLFCSTLAALCNGELGDEKVTFAHKVLTDGELKCEAATKQPLFLPLRNPRRA